MTVNEDNSQSQRPSDWVRQHAQHISRAGPVLDLACGSGRHTRLLLQMGHAVVATDRDLSGIEGLRNEPGLKSLQADLEAGAWPFGDSKFAGIVVTNYLHRPNFPDLIRALQPGGILIYETFALGHEKFGRPHNPAFLLQPNELLQAFQPVLEILAYEQIEFPAPHRAVKQRICARMN
jgi:SAM-dependent methyltransferase